MANTHRKEDMLGKNKNIIFFSIVITVIILDRITKYIALNYITEEISIIPNLISLIFTTNTGAAFGILKGKTIILTIIAFLFIGLILFKLKEILVEKYYWCAALILGGAFSNVFDRIFNSDGFFNGYVIDFISVNYFSVFNLADSAITIGAIGLIIYLLIDIKNTKTAKLE